MEGEGYNPDRWVWFGRLKSGGGDGMVEGGPHSIALDGRKGVRMYPFPFPLVLSFVLFFTSYFFADIGSRRPGSLTVTAGDRMASRRIASVCVCVILYIILLLPWDSEQLYPRPDPAQHHPRNRRIQPSKCGALLKEDCRAMSFKLMLAWAA